MKGYIAALLFGAAMAAPAAHEKRSLVLVEEVVTQWSTVTVYKHKATGKPGFFFPSGFTRSASASSTASASSVSSIASVASISSTSSAAAPPTTSAPAVLSSIEPIVAKIASSVVSAVPSIAVPSVSAPAPVVPATGGGPSGTGEITYYSLGLVSCGQVYSDSDDVVALATSVMANGGNSNNNPLCGKTINISYGGVTATAKVVDTCEGCAPGNIDLSPSLFQKFAPLGAGRVPGVTWSVNM